MKIHCWTTLFLVTPQNIDETYCTLQAGLYYKFNFYRYAVSLLIKYDCLNPWKIREYLLKIIILYIYWSAHLTHFPFLPFYLLLPL